MPFWVQGSKITLFEKYVEGKKVVFERKLGRNFEIGENADFLLQSLVIMVSQFLVLVTRTRISTAVYILLVIVKYSRS